MMIKCIKYVLFISLLDLVYFFKNLKCNFLTEQKNSFFFSLFFNLIYGHIFVAGIVRRKVFKMVFFNLKMGSCPVDFIMDGMVFSFFFGKIGWKRESFHNLPVANICNDLSLIFFFLFYLLVYQKNIKTNLNQEVTGLY